MMSLEKYQILHEIGRGGMGLVYLANDLRLDRTVAIKELIISPAVIGKDKEDIVARFKREAQTAAKLNHPNIITIFDVIEEKDKNYIAMEYLPGKSLKDYLEEKYRFTFEEAIDILLQIASGLDHAHSKSIIHRDIKPENIKILENNVIKIMDFGIASIENNNSSLTQDGTLLGTIAYISPEQLYNSKNVDSRADIFSFGVMMYEMFTGRLPFDGDTIGATIVKIMSENPKPPKQLNSNIKSELEDIILKCLEKDPDKRYQKIRELAQELLYFKLSLSNKELYQEINVDNVSIRSSLSSDTVTITNPRMTIPGINSLKKRKFSILHIEDDETIEKIFASSMSKKGFAFEYKFVKTIEHARNVLNSEIFDLVICDFHLPDGNFFDIFDDISHLSIMVTTSVSDPDLIIEVMKKGVTDYVIKTPDLKYIDKIHHLIKERVDKEEASFVINQKMKTHYEVTFLKTIGGAGSENGHFSSPRWVYFSKEQNLFVADTKNSRIQIFDKSGNFISSLTEPSMQAPCAVSTDQQGNIYVIDALDCKVRVFDENSNLIKEFGGKGDNIGQFKSVYGLAIFKNEKIYITDPDDHRVQIFNLSGELIEVFTTGNSNHGEYKSPSSICTNDKYIYILDHSVPKVKVINSSGVPELLFGKRGTGKGDFSVPKGIGVDSEGRIYVTETLSHRVQVFNKKGEWIYTFGSKGSDNGQFNGAESVAISDDGHIFVLDRGNNRIQVFSYPV